MQGDAVLQYRKFWLSLGWLLVASVWYLSLTPTPPEIDTGIEFFDKISHFTAYAVMMGWFIQLYHVTRARFFYALGFISMGVIIEFLQGLGPARLFEVADMLANSSGVIVILIVMNTKVSKIFYAVEQNITNKNAC